MGAATSAPASLPPGPRAQPAAGPLRLQSAAAAAATPLQPAAAATPLLQPAAVATPPPSNPSAGLRGDQPLALVAEPPPAVVPQPLAAPPARLPAGPPGPPVAADDDVSTIITDGWVDHDDDPELDGQFPKPAAPPGSVGVCGDQPPQLPTSQPPGSVGICGGDQVGVRGDQAQAGGATEAAAAEDEDVVTSDNDINTAVQAGDVSQQLGRVMCLSSWDDAGPFANMFPLAAWHYSARRQSSPAALTTSSSCCRPKVSTPLPSRG